MAFQRVQYQDAVRLRTHLILLTLATVVPVVLFAVGLIIYHTRLERSSLERGMRDTARALALALDRDVNDIKTGVETLAGSQYLDGRVDLAHFYEEAATISKGLGAWAVLSDPSGRQVLNTSRPLGSALPIPTLASLEMMKSVAASRTTFVSNIFIKGEVLRGPPVYAAYKRSKATGWTVSVAAPIKLVDAGIRHSLLALSSGGLLLLAVGCG